MKWDPKYPITYVEDYHPREVEKIMHSVLAQKIETVIPKWVYPIAAVLLIILLGVIHGL